MPATTMSCNKPQLATGKSIEFVQKNIYKMPLISYYLGKGNILDI